MQTATDIDHPHVQQEIGKADIIVYQRNVIHPLVWRSMDYWRALGKIVLVDLDDHYPMIPPSNPAFPYWMENTQGLDPHPIEALKEGLEHADALISPSHVILKDWEHIIPGYYWPNYPALKDYENLERRELGAPDINYAYDPPDDAESEDQDERRPKLKWNLREGSEGQIVIGWGGSLSHIDSFAYSGFIEGMARLMEENPKVVFKFCGNEDRMDFLLKRMPAKQVVRQGGVDAYDWPKVLSTFDIGVAPMDLRPVPSETGNGETWENAKLSYDERRSWLKLVEYVVAGIPFVATDCEPYKELARFGKVIPNGEETWYAALKSRVDGIVHFRAEAMKNRQYGLKKLTQEANADRLIQLYLQIGEETQAKNNMRLPDVIYVSEPPEDEDWEPVRLPVTIKREGDPLETEHAPWNDEVQRVAENWDGSLSLTFGDIELARTMEYALLEKLNQAYIRRADDGEG
jgi:glycosyltransferase involved in cell wall biosynthesis